MNFLPAVTSRAQATFSNGAHLGAIQEEGYRRPRERQDISPVSSNDISEPSSDIKVPPSKRPRFNYECDACGTTYTEKRALARHRHTDMHRRRLGLEPDKRHLCVKCGRSFGRNHDLQRHRREQHGEATGATTIDVSSTCASEGSSSAMSADDALRGNHLHGLKSPTLISPTHKSPTLISPTHKSPTHVSPTPKSPTLKSPGESKTGPTQGASYQSKDSRRSPQLSVKAESDEGSNGRVWPEEMRDVASQWLFTPPLKQESTASSRNSSVSLRNSDISSAQTNSPSSQHRQADQSTPRARAKLLASQASARPRNLEAMRFVRCMVCGAAFEEDDALIDHLQSHLEGFKGKHRCEKCQIGFDHEEDLQSHLDSARRGHCGFRFAHNEPCTGHHPPGGKGSAGGRMPDSDCFRLENRLRHWEQAQLHAYIADINDLIASRDQRSQSRWSVEALLRSHRHSTTSFRSVAISVNSYATAPCDRSNGRLDIEGLQKRMKKMSFKEVGASVKHLMGKSSSPLPGPYDKSLQQAIQRHNLKKANELLQSGADPSILKSASGTLTAAALWDSSEVQSLTVAHRLTEDIQGSCDVCKMNSATFPRGSNKIKAMLAHGADAAQAGGVCGTPINSAAWLCKADIVLLLLQHQAYVNQKDPKFGSPLGVAASQAGFPGSDEVVETLLSYGANIDIHGKEGKPLDLAKRRLEYWEDSPSSMQISPDVVEVRIGVCREIIRLLEEAHNGRQFT